MTESQEVEHLVRSMLIERRIRLSGPRFVSKIILKKFARKQRGTKKKSNEKGS